MLNVQSKNLINYLSLANQQGLLEFRDLDVVVLPVVVAELLLPAGVVHEGVVGGYGEVDVIYAITLVVVSKQKR